MMFGGDDRGAGSDSPDSETASVRSSSGEDPSNVVIVTRRAQPRQARSLSKRRSAGLGGVRIVRSPPAPIARMMAGAARP